MKRLQSLLVLMLFVAISPLTATKAHAALELAPIFDNHMVLQQGKATRIWGKADKGQYVTIAFVGLKKWGEPGEVDPFAAPFVEFNTGANVDDNGNWSVDIEDVDLPGHYELVVSMGQQNIIVEDVLVGDVYAVLGEGETGDVDAAEGVRIGTGKGWADQSAPAAAIEFANAQAETAEAPVAIVVLDKANLIGPAGGLAIKGFVSLDGTEAPSKDEYKPAAGCTCTVFDAKGEKVSAACTACGTDGCSC